MDVLIEINLAEEESKTGISKGEVQELIEAIVSECESVRVRGIMCIPPRQMTQRILVNTLGRRKGFLRNSRN